MTVKKFILSVVVTVIMVCTFHTLSSESRADTTTIKSNGRIMHNNRTPDNNDDVVLFDADDIKMLNNRLVQLEARIEQLRNR